ncbi:retrotransposon protein, putative, ty1-copia subclass [Tanacetum coccineum]
MFITLIPKIPDANLIKDFRPISLIGSLYKIITKILANRLVPVIGSIVHEVQSAFVAERQIMDGPFILNEIIQWCSRKKKQAIIFKVDFEKAYDSVRWDFLDDVLNKFGFGNKWRGWIQNCLKSSKGSVLVNGSPTAEFQNFCSGKDRDVSLRSKTGSSQRGIFIASSRARWCQKGRQLNAMLETVGQVTFVPQVDRYNWSPNNGTFSVASKRKLIDDHQNPLWRLRTRMTNEPNVTAPMKVEPPAKGQASNAQVVQAVEAWRHSDFLCHNYVLNGLVDSLYNVYLQQTDNVLCVVVGTQVQKLRVDGFASDIHAEGMTLSETFQVAVTIEKLPPSWVEFKNYLKHKRKEMSVEDLHAGSSSKSNSKAKGKGKKKNDKKSKGKAEYLARARNCETEVQGTCYNCNQPGHRAAICKMPKRVNPRQANMVNDNMDMIAMVSDVIAMISEVNLVGSNNSSWWVDTGVTRHVCANKSVFHSFRAVDNGEKLYMGKSATADIKGEGDVIWKLTSDERAQVDYVIGYAVMYCYVYLLKSKDEAIYKFVLYKTEVENQLGRKIKVVRSDRGGEYVSPFTELCAKHGIRHEFTAPYSPQQNGAEDNIISVHTRVGGELPSQGMQVMDQGMLPSFENVFPCLTKETGSSSRLDDEVVHDKRQRDDNDLRDERQDQLEEEEVEPRRSKRATITEKIHLDPIFEIDSVLQNHREVVDLPPGCKPLGYKWIFKKKMKADGTIDKYKARLLSSRYPTVIEGYSDAKWISDIKDPRSTSGYVFTLGGLLFLEVLQAIRAHSTMYNGKFTHILRRHNSIRQLLSTGVISIGYVKSKDNIADPLTKGLSRELVSKSSKGMGLKPLKE